MKNRRLICLCTILIMWNTANLSGANADAYDESWMEPHAWSAGEECCKCDQMSALPATNDGLLQNNNEPKFTEDGVAIMYLRRWLSQIFDRKKLKHDDMSNAYKRTLCFSLTPSQLDKIEKWQDPRDLDEIMTEMFSKSKMVCDGQTGATKMETGFTALIIDIFIDLYQMTKISEIRFLLAAVLVIMCGWFLNKKYHISYFTLVGGALFLFGYLHTYLECNRELEVNEMMEVLQLAEKPRTSGLMGFLQKIFSGSKSDIEQSEVLKKSTKVKLGFCRPDHVAIMYFNDIFLKYLEVLLNQCATTLNTLQSKLPWPFNYFASIMLMCIIGFIIKLTFKYILSPRAWSHMWHMNSSHNIVHNPNAAIGQGDANVHNVDRISGENLKKLLNILSPEATSSNLSTAPAVSGVEEVREAIESAPVNNTSTSSASNSDTSLSNSTSKVKNNNDPLKKPISQDSDVTLEDLPDES